jgi:regulator of sigma E protease
MVESLTRFAGSAGNFLLVALGLGLVIFIHELGHFAVAKWCGVRVERFSIGFGPVLLRFTNGDTEYALSLIPLGGYVKMLGQDDADPATLTDTEIARNPRSYTSKTVPQRMAIISAGVIMNLITAAGFFILAFLLGVHYEPAVLGNVVPGYPAWRAGLQPGDRITRIGSVSDEQLRFMDIRQGVALSRDDIVIGGVRADGDTFETTISPRLPGKNSSAYFPVVGVTPIDSLQFLDVDLFGSNKPAYPNTPAAEADFRFRDEVIAVDGKPVSDYIDFSRAMFHARDKTVPLTIRRKVEEGRYEERTVTVGPNPLRTIGLQMDIGRVVAIRPDGPAAKAGVREGDKFTHVTIDGVEKEVGREVDPLRLPELFADRHGQPVKFRVRRDSGGGVEPASVELTVTPADFGAWTERASMFDADQPMSIPAIGVAVHILNTVLKVEPGSPADGKIRENDTVQLVKFTPPLDANGKPIADGFDSRRAVEFELNDEKRNWAGVFFAMQDMRLRPVRLKVLSPGEKEPRTVELTPVHADDWFHVTRGFLFNPIVKVRRASGVADAVQLGFRDTWSNFKSMYAQLVSMVTGRIKPQAIGGPIRIFEVAYRVSERGFADLVLFLGTLSVSLAVLNFLPIPVLDGGHFVFLMYEAIRGKPADERVVIGATYVGLVMILMLMCWAFYRDIGTLMGWLT